MLRAGYSKMDFATESANPSAFDMGRMYYGASLGGGYVFEPSPKLAVDLYGYGSWLSLAKKNVDDNLHEHIRFERADSLRFVSGFRASYSADKRLRPYAGVAFDWETMGRPRATIDGYQADRADISGASGLVELGINGQLDRNVFIDAKVSGVFGLRDGIGGMVEFRYRF
jgi:outer membrane autotransporter protein